MKGITDPMKAVYYFMPFICAAIGWGTNFLAVKMLFRPHYERKLFGCRIQGVLPKRQVQIAEAVGEAIEKELVKKEDLESMFSRISREKINLVVDKIIDEKFRLYKLNSIYLVNEFHKRIIHALKSFIRREAIRTLERQSGLNADLAESAGIRNLVTDRIKSFSAEELEKATFAVIDKELRFIELIGAAIGFFIGLTQLAFYIL